MSDNRDLQSNFVATVTHEFRTPLSSLKASLELFSDELDHLSKAEMRELLSSIGLSVTNLQTLVDNLLNSASIEARRFTINPHSVSIHEVLRGAIHLMQPILNRRHQ